MMSDNKEFEELLADAVRREEAGEKIETEVINKINSEIRGRIKALEKKALRRLATKQLPENAPEDEIAAKIEEIKKEFDTLQKPDGWEGLDQDQLFKKLSLIFDEGEGK